MRLYLVFAAALLSSGCFSADNFASCTGPAQCGRQGNSDRLFICVEGECVEPQPTTNLVSWEPNLPAGQDVVIDRVVDLSSGVTAGQALVIDQRVIVIEANGKIDLTGAGHPGGGGGGGGRGVAESGANDTSMPGNGGVVATGESGERGAVTSGGAGGAGTGRNGGLGGTGDQDSPFTGRECSSGTGGSGQAGAHDLSRIDGAFDPCAAIPKDAPPMGGGGGGGGGGRGGSSDGMIWGGAGGGVGGNGGGALILRATDYIEIRGVLSAAGQPGSTPPRCMRCPMGGGGHGGGDGTSNSSQTVSGPECAGGVGGSGAGGLVYIEAPKIILGINSEIRVGQPGELNTGGQVVLRGEIEVERIESLSQHIVGIGLHSSDAALLCYGAFNANGLF